MHKKRLLSNSRFIMTLPDERYRAVLAAERLLKDLCDRSKTPRVPRDIRDRARSVLRHYPGEYDMERCIEGSMVFAKHLDPLYKMVKQHDLGDQVVEELTELRKSGSL
jgi:hypothetical protein